MKYLIPVVAVFLLNSCGKPHISDILKDAINCKAKIQMPEGYRGEPIEVSVQIFDCTEASPTYLRGVP